MVDRSIYLILCLIICCYHFSIIPCYAETDNLHQGQQLKDWDYLISSNRVFILKFFGSSSTAISPYLGVFYHYNKVHFKSPYDYRYMEQLPDKSVWVANRNNPVTVTDAKLVIGVNGKLSIISSRGTILDLFSPSLVTRNASVKLLESGNLVLQELYPDGSVERILWQSFDNPTDTLLPGMKLGVNHKTGHRWSLTSWASDRLAAPGSFSLKMDPNGTGQMVIMRHGKIHWKSGPWLNDGFENANLDSSGVHVRLYYTSNETEQSFTYLTRSYESYPALTMHQDGQLKGSVLNFDVQCGSINDPGCAEYEFENLKCRKGYYFSEPYGYIFEDEYVYDESYNLTLYDCKRICWSNCSCVGYTYATQNMVGCKTYSKMRYNEAEDRYSQHTNYYAIVNFEVKKKRNWIWLIIGFGSLAPLISFYFLEKKLHIRDKGKIIQKMVLHKLRRLYDYIQADRNMNNELDYFTFQSISIATNNFSSTNKLGEGGFGAVYKGVLVDGQEVAVKRLSRSSEQGVTEFKNETELIAKLQHTNLVRIIGCCVEKKEKILVYEYMPNNSLDFFLFDSDKKGLLEWRNRFAIINGIAQGLLYLHKFSRLRVIHRDLKASNILLDDHLNPKISDFGMAKLFATNESQANTTRVVGTRGYMPPEYMMDGTVSIKTDVFSFGVLLLEIVSSKMNHGSHDTEHPLNLLGLAWELWNESRGLELMDQVLEGSCNHKEVMTCIHVGLLCVQDHAMERPSMSDVISMLTNENMELPVPKRPAFYIERHEVKETGDDRLGNGSVNGQSVSIVFGR